MTDVNVARKKKKKKKNLNSICFTLGRRTISSLSESKTLSKFQQKKEILSLSNVKQNLVGSRSNGLSHSKKSTFGLGHEVTPVKNSRQLVGRSIGGQPLIHMKNGLTTALVRPSRRHLNKITEPTMMGPRPIRSQIQPAYGCSDTWASARKYIKISPFEVIMFTAH